MKKVLIFTDSLGLPRPNPEIVNYNETWIFLLSQKYHTHQISVGGGEITVLSAQIEYAKMFNPDFVIVQSGIVDCAPRALTKTESRILNKYSLSRTILKFILRPKTLNLLRKNRNAVYTEKTIFEKHIMKFLKAFDLKLFWIGIIPATNEYEKIVPGISAKINEYNLIIKKHLGTNYIDLYDIKTSHVMSDFIHLSKEGHQFVYEKIANVLELKNV